MTMLMLPVVGWIMIGSYNCVVGQDDTWVCSSGVVLPTETKNECQDLLRSFLEIAKEKPETFNARAFCAALIEDSERET